jgi:hypothetical protein
MTIEEARNLKYGDILYHTINKNADGTKQRWKVTGKVKTWKKNPDRILIPVKNGLYNFGYIKSHDLHLVTLEE